MVDDEKVYDFTKLSDVLDFFYDKFDACGCSDLETIIRVIQGLLEWLSSDIAERAGFETLFNGNEGVFYLLAGKLENLCFSEHGTSIRYAWITEKGTVFLNAIKDITAEQIEDLEEN